MAELQNDERIINTVSITEPVTVGILNDPTAKHALEPAHDPVNHPKHYTDHPSGIECIQITEHMGFNLGNAIKYIWRCDLKKLAIEDLQKAIWYIQREIDKRKREQGVL